MTRDDVIRGLECCTAELGNNQHRDDFCTMCPYRDKSPDKWYCFRQQDLMRDALALLKAQEQKCRECGEATSKAIQELQTKLKAQEPRVLTLEEVLATEVVYTEDIDKAEIIPVLVDRRAHDRIVLVRAHLMGGPSLTIYPLISEYGKRWRCWTSRPDEKRRAETPWN